MSVEDVAQEVELRQWELNNQRREMKRYLPTDPGYGPEFCEDEDCGEPLPALRREFGCKLCTDCQTILEKKRRRGL